MKTNPATSRQRRLAGLIAASALVLASCGDSSPEPAAAPEARTDVPEPAVAPSDNVAPAGRVVTLGGGEPEGLAFDPVTGLVAVALRKPDAIALVDLASGVEKARVPLGGPARHLQLERPGGPVLAPSESNDRLYRIALPGGEVVGDTPVGRQPHDAAPAAGGVVFVGDELADTVRVVAPDGTSRVVPGPVQPGGVAASADGSVAVVVGVRGRLIEAYAPDGRSLGTSPCGIGPTHVRAGAGRLFYVADTQGGAVLVFEAGDHGIRQVGQVSTDGGAPYGLAVDNARGALYVTLTETNELRSFRIDGARLTSDRTWPTVAQPNDVAVDEKTGRVVVAGTAAGLLQLLDP